MTWTAEDNPLTAIDDLIAARLRGFAPLVAVVPVSAMSFWERDLDIRGDEEEDQVPDPDQSKLWIRPLPSPTDFYATSGKVRFERNYAIGFGHGGLALAKLRLLELLVIAAMLPGQTFTTEEVDTSPIVLESIGVGSTDPEKAPIDTPEWWNDVCEIKVVGYALRSELIVAA